jgi:uncharacterized surface protein with fasciclin (FAS1) repeats
MNRTTLVLATSLALLGCANASKDSTTAPTTGTPTTGSTDGAATTGNIIEVATAAGKFNTLATALKAAGLIETLQGPGPFTVFAPTDEAFAKLPPGALDKLLADPKQLEAVLLLHVVSGKVMAADVAGMTEATAMSGGKLPIDASNGVKIGAATVTTADVAASNGVIHIIDTVLLPG